MMIKYFIGRGLLRYLLDEVDKKKAQKDLNKIYKKLKKQKILFFQLKT